MLMKGNSYGTISLETKGKYTTSDEAESNISEQATAHIVLSMDDDACGEYTSVVIQFHGCEYWYNDNGTTMAFDFQSTQQIKIMRKETQDS